MLGISRALRVSGFVVAVLALSPFPATGQAAQAATTASSSLTKSGSDPATASTTDSAAATVGSTQVGDTISWVLHYRNISGALATTDLTDPLGPGQTFVPGSLQVPQGLSPEWSTDGGTTFSTTEPSSGVDAVGAKGTSVPGSTGASALFPPPAGSFSGAAGGGDGWEAIFWGNNIYNVRHHLYVGATGTMLDCHDKGTGARCPAFAGSAGLNIPMTAGAPFSSAPVPYDTPPLNFSAVDRRTGRLYTPVGIDATKQVGLICADLTTNTSCGFIQLGTSTAGNANIGPNGGGAQIGGAAQIGSKVYVIGDHGQLFCHDITANAACPGYGTPLNTIGALTMTPEGAANLGAGGNARVFDGRYVFTNVFDGALNRHIVSCVDTTTDTVCAGFPNVVPGAGYKWDFGLHPILDAGGAVTGICATAVPAASVNGPTNTLACFDLSGAAVANPYPQQAPGQFGLSSIGQGTVIGTKVYLPYQNRGVPSLPTTYTCFDFALGAAGAPCTGFNQALNTTTSQDIQPYTLRQDDDNPSCIWEVGNAGIFQVFDATTGRLGCPTTSVTVKPSTSYCDGAAGHVQGWDQVTLGGVGFAQYTQATITITDANGDPVPGFNAIVLPSTQQTLDISSIPITGSTSTINVHADLAGLDAGVQPRLIVTFKGDPAQVCFQTKVADPGCTTHATDITNAAKVVTVGANGVSDAPDGDPSGTARFTLPRHLAGCSADLEVVKTGPSSPVVPGQDATYTLQVTNHGPDDAVDVSVSDPLPAGETFASASPGCAETAGTVTCTLTSLAAGAGASFTVVAHVAGSATGSLDNTATVTSPSPDPNPANNTDTATTPLAPVSDLSIVKTGPGSAAALEPLTYTLTVTNNGTSTSPEETVSDPLPPDLTFVAATPEAGRGSCTGGQNVSCKLGPLATGESVAIAVVAIPSKSMVGLSVPNTATVGGPNPDPAPQNNSSTAQVLIRPALPDLRVTKRLASGTPRVGEQLRYAIVVDNIGQGPATDAIVTDTLPAGLRFVRAGTTTGTCSGTQVQRCAVGTIPVGGQVRIDVVVQVTRDGAIGNSAGATSSEPDKNPQDNIATVVSASSAAVDPVLRKQADRAFAVRGRSMPYTITFRNPGAGTLRNVKVCDTLPEGETYRSSSAGARLVRGKVCWTIKSIAAGSSRTFHLLARVDDDARGRRVTNTVTATAAGMRAKTARATVPLRGISPSRAGGVTG